MLKLWRMWSILLLPSIPGPLWLRVVESDRVLSMLVGVWVLWHNNLCRLFNAKSIFVQMNSSISKNSD